MGGRHIVVTTLQRIEHFFEELLDVFSVLQGFLRGAGFGWFLARAVYILIWYSVCGVVWCGVVWCGVVWSSPPDCTQQSDPRIIPPALPYYMYHSLKWNSFWTVVLHCSWVQ